MYHSALKGFKQYHKKCSYVNTKNITAFVFDIENDKVPNEFFTADFIYLDLPYRKGYDVFNKRAEKRGKGYSYLMFKILKILNELNKSFYLIGEKNISQLRVFLKHDVYYSIHKCKTYLYSNDSDIKVNSTSELLNYLFEKYNVGLDFMCGYGNTGKIAIEKNKRAILTDYNEKCIGYIYENLQ